jgi:hypothetical protein
MKIIVFCGVTPCGPCKNRRFGGTYRLHHQGKRNQRAENVRRNLTCNGDFWSLILVTLMMEAIRSSETCLIQIPSVCFQIRSPKAAFGTSCSLAFQWILNASLNIKMKSLWTMSSDLPPLWITLLHGTVNYVGNVTFPGWGRGSPKCYDALSQWQLAKDKIDPEEAPTVNMLITLLYSKCIRIIKNWCFVSSTSYWGLEGLWAQLTFYMLLILRKMKIRDCYRD